jgi:hypothetical protein
MLVHANLAAASGARTASGGEVFTAVDTERPCESDSPIFGSPGSSESQAQHCQVAHENDLTFGSRDGRVDPVEVYEAMIRRRKELPAIAPRGYPESIEPGQSGR